jgi:DNA-binding transcriptional ArsR family regulator
MLDIYSAVSDPTRRLILGRLRTEGALSVTALSQTVTMSRQAVTKHLDLLEGAGLIFRKTKGRERLHVLRVEPLQEMEEWLAPFSAAWDERLARLKTHVDGGDGDGVSDDGDDDE